MLEGGQGYWVKVSEEDELRVSGTLLSSDYKTPLASGWNLVGFTGGQALVADYYATEIANDELIYVTGFDEGSSVYDPNGLSFLNTLNTLNAGLRDAPRTKLSVSRSLVRAHVLCSRCTRPYWQSVY